MFKRIFSIIFSFILSNETAFGNSYYEFFQYVYKKEHAQRKKSPVFAKNPQKTVRAKSVI